MRCGGGGVVVVVGTGGVGTEAVCVVAGAAGIVVFVVVVVGCDGVALDGRREPPDGWAPVWPPGWLLWRPFSVPVGDVDFVGRLPPVWFVCPEVGLAGVWNWIVAVPPVPALTSVTWTVTS